MDQKIKTNAFISYFFLGFLFLLAKNNPNFSDPFVRSHAKAATMLHTICLFVVIGVFYGLSPLVSNISLPFVLLRFDQALNSLVCIIVIIVLAIAAARALRGLPPIGFSNVWSRISLAHLDKTGTQNIGKLNESEKTLLFVSYLPFIGHIVARRFGRVIGQEGAKIGGLLTFLFILLFVLGFSSSAFFVLFVHVMIIAYVGVSILFRDSIDIFAIINRLPNIEQLHALIRAGFIWIGRFCALLFGSRKASTFTECLQSVSDLNVWNKQETLELKKPFPPVIAAIPFGPILWLKFVIKNPTSPYRSFVFQELILTTLFCLIWIWIGFDAPIQLLLLFPLVWGIASSYESQPRAIPFLVDIERGITRMARLFFRTKKAIDQKNITSTMTFRVGDKGGGDQASAK